MRAITRTYLLSVSIALGATAALANPATFSVTVFPTIGNTAFPCASGTTNLQGNSGQSLSNTCGPNGGTIAGAAQARPGHDGAAATAQGGGSMRSIAEFTDNVIFTSLDPNAPQDNILAALNLAFNGSIRVGGVLSQDQFSDAGYSLSVVIGSNGFTRSTQMFNQRASTQTANGLSFATGGEVLNEGNSDSVSGLLTTPFFAVPLNQAVFIDITLQIIGEGFDANSDFLGSIDFPTGQDVFTLPGPGLYTANAVGSELIGNRYGAAAVSPVPEPGTTALLAVALGAMALHRRRFKGVSRDA
jgi:hypothetical protein